MTYDRNFTGKTAIAAVQYGKEGEYWLKKFSGELQKIIFPYDYIDSQPKQQSKDNITFELRNPYVSTLMELSKGMDYRLYIILTAGLAALLYKYTGNKDIVIGSPIFKQDKEGNFINTMLPLRNPVDGGMTFKELLLDHVRQTVIEANQHQNYPIETLLFQLNMTVIREKFPLFDVVILLENIHEKKYIHSVHPNVVFSFLRTDDGIEGKVEYNPALYRPDTIRRIIHHFKHLLAQVLVNVNIVISEIDILGDGEKKQILYDFNKGYQQARAPHHRTLHQIFAQQVERTPDNTALAGENPKFQIPNSKHGVPFGQINAFGGGYLSYRELNEKSDRLAHFLIEKGVKPDTIVGMMVERSLEMIIGILGILKAGGGYMPIDPDYPQERIDFMLKDSNAKILLTHKEIAAAVFSSSTSTLTLTSTCKVSATNLAYVIYTSGTTGKPKGSLIQHGNVVSLMFHDNYLFTFNSSDVWTMFHSYCFDFSVWEMYGALLYGGKLVLISKMVARDPQQYLQVLKSEQVTVLNQTPAAFYQLAQQELDNPGRNLRLKYVIFGGEALTPAKLKRWKEKYPGTKLINMFGITETTVHVTHKEIDPMDIQSNISNIGGPLPTLNTYVTDRHQNLLPIGVPGELSVSGEGVCRGYLNQPELTAEKFDHDLWDFNNKKLLRGVQGAPWHGGPIRDGFAVEDVFDNSTFACNLHLAPLAPLAKKSPPGRRRQRIYRSGDLTRWLPDGNIEYLGRIDHQVKIRGYRVELGEIEAQLVRYFAVKEAAALEWEDPDGHKALNAYVVPDPQYAYPVKQLTELERAGRLENHPHHEYPNGMTIFYINRHETDFMYREIFEEQSYIKHGVTLEEGACIFDVGANIGMFSLFVHHICKNAKIYAFEPIPPIFEVLSLNTSIYCRDLEVFPYGLSQKESEAVFTYYPHAAVLSGRFADQLQETETVKAFIKNEPKENPEEDRLSEGQINELLEERLKSTSFTCSMKSLSQIIREKEIEIIDLLKIDVEKAEIDVLKGIDEADWPKIRQLVIEVHDVDEGLEKVTQQLRRRGYRVLVQQDSELKNTNLYNVYALSEARSAPGTQRPDMVTNKAGDDRDYYLSPGRFRDDLRTFLKEKVPEYMVPSYFVLLDHIPLNPNGKIHRKALPSPEIKTDKGYIAPRNQVEIILAEIWAEVLRIEKDAIGIDSDFFQVGGHSLKATIFISKLHKRLNVKIPLAILFKIPTIRELAQYIGGLKMNRFIGLEAVEKKEYYPLSSAQKRLYVLQQMELESIAYNVLQVKVLEGELNKKALENTFHEMIKRHESLRTSFDMVNAEPMQRIYKDVNCEIVHYDLTTKEENYKIQNTMPLSIKKAGVVLIPNHKSQITNNKETEGHHSLFILHHSFVRPFDLSQAPLLRVGLIKVEDRKHILIVAMHHIITDGTSMDLFVKESMALYAQEELLPLKFQYKDYSQWQNSDLQKKALKEQERYWLKQFADEVPVLDMPLDFPRPEVQSYEGSTLNFELLSWQTRGLKDLAGEEGVTLYILLLAITGVFFSKISNQEDIVLGTPIAARRHADLERIIGMFVNTLALRNFPSAEKPFTIFLKEVKERTLNAFENQDYPFEDLVQKVVLDRDLSRNPLFCVMFLLQNMEASTRQIPAVEIPQLRITPYEYENKTSQFDIIFGCNEGGEKLFFTVEYLTRLFKKGTIKRFISYYKHIVAAVLEDKHRKISEIEILADIERVEVLYLFNNTDNDYPRDKTIIELFEDQVERSPYYTALLGPTLQTTINQPISITYKKLNEKSNQLAHLLEAKGIKFDAIVGILVERSLEMIIGIMGILKAGGAYMPIDPNYPPERIAYMMADSSATILLASQDLSKEIKFEKEIVSLSDAINRVPTANHLPLPPAPAASLAYVIYTSGSTGKPKGVMVEHFSLVNRLNWMQRCYPQGVTDVILHKTPFTFDVSVWELCWWGITGARVCLLEVGVEKIPEKLIEAIEKNGITTMHFVPSLLIVFLEYVENSGDLKRLSPLKRVFASGEPLGIHHVEMFNKLLNENNRTKLINLYGPTEATVDVSYFNCSIDEKPGIIPIGKPIDNIHLYIVDSNLNLQPIGVNGELCIAGHGLARGYLNRPTLTSDKFGKAVIGHSHISDNSSPNDQCPMTIDRFYRTGDLARWLPDGNIEFLGRLDQQVKIRGYRIEPGEIEKKLLKYEEIEIKEAVVIAIDGSEGMKYLCAYFVPGGEISIPDLKDYLEKELPAYMIPSYFEKVDHMPLLPNGKINRGALPQPSAVGFPETFVPPETHQQQTLAEIWAGVLDMDPNKVGIHDSFFALGGDSIRSISVVSRAREKGLNFSTQQVFQFPTISGLIKHINETDDIGQTRIGSGLSPFGLISPEDRLKIPDGIEDAFPLAMLQAGLIFQSELTHGTSQYHDVETYTLKSRFDLRLFRESVRRLVKRHPICRITYDLNNYSQYLQLVHKEIPLPLSVKDLTGFSPEQQKDIIKAAVETESTRHIDWGEPGIIRFVIHVLGDETYQYTFSFHDSALDGWSAAALNTELFLTYFSLLKDKNFPEKPPLEVLFRDFIALEREVMQSEEARNYWDKLLADSTFTEVPRWPFEPMENETLRVCVLNIPLPAGLSEGIKQLAQSRNVPIKTILIACHCNVLRVLSSNGDILTGYEHSGRPEEKDGEKVLGLFLNTIPFRLKLTGGSWTNLIQDAYRAEIGFLPYRRYPMALMKQERKGEPLFETVFNFTHFHVMKPLRDLEQIKLLESDVVAETEFVLRAEFGQSSFSDEVKFDLHYHTKVFGKHQVQTIGNYYVETLQAMIRDPLSRYEFQSIIPGEEKKQLLETFNSTSTDYPAGKCFHQLFQMQVQRTPGVTAAVFKEEQVDYYHLNKRANRLAAALTKRGVGPEHIIGVVMKRGIELLTTILAIFKAGGVYLPLDPHSPRERLVKTLNQSGCRLVLTVNALITDLIHLLYPAKMEKDKEVFPVEVLWESESIEANSSPRTAPHHLSYVIYTSGSTGSPKGVMIEHRGMLNHLYAKISHLMLTDTDAIAQNASQCFDISIWQFLAALLKGGKTVIYPDELVMNPDQLMSRVEEDRVTVLEVVPSYLSIMLGLLAKESRTFEGLKFLLVTGETLKPQLAARWYEIYPHIPIVNAYGPTEASDDITHYFIPNRPNINFLERMPIGKPLPNLSIYIVDEYMQLCPTAVKGEVCVSGIGVGRGYLNNPELTAGKFVLAHSSRLKADRETMKVAVKFAVNYELSAIGYIYKTGDLGCWLPDGNIDFYGRKDHQVKIRGFRIELGEIENLLLKQKEIKEAVVISNQEDKTNECLLAYLVSDQELDVPGLKDYLSTYLPGYMIPSFFVRINQIPLTANGKLDKDSLPDPRRNGITKAAYTAPRNEQERKIVKIWSEVLAIEEQKISIYDNFFDLGGHSLKAMEIMFKSGGEFPLVSIFRNPTPKKLAESIIDNGNEDLKRTGSNQLLHKFSKTKKNEVVSIICFPYAGGSAVVYKSLCDSLSQLSDKMALYAVELPGHNFISGEIELKSIREIAQHCIREIKKKINTPIIIWGHCSGTAPALEVARLLEHNGFDLRFVCLAGRLIHDSFRVRKRSLLSYLQSLVKPEKKLTDEEIFQWLVDFTGFTEFQGLAEKESAFVIKNFRHDAESANEFFKNFLQRKNPWKLKASIYNIIARDDPLTSDYRKKYQNWQRFSPSLDLIVLDEGGHYFIKTKPQQTARILTDLWNQHK